MADAFSAEGFGARLLLAADGFLTVVEEAS